jgi:hypothetical protein
MEYIIGIEFLKNIPQTGTAPRRRHPAAWIRFTRDSVPWLSAPKITE